MLCRNAGLAKSAIGAIRVQYKETFVEIANADVPAMKQELGEGLALEQDAALTELAGLPDFNASPKGPSGEPRPVQAAGEKPKSRRDKTSKPAPSGKAPQPKHAKPAPHWAKSDAPPPEKAARPAKSKNAKPRDAPPKTAVDATKPKSKQGEKQSKQKIRDKRAFEKSKPSGPGKARSTPKAKAKDGKPIQRTRGKGGDARPFRKTAKRP